MNIVWILFICFSSVMFALGSVVCFCSMFCFCVFVYRIVFILASIRNLEKHTQNKILTY